VLYRFLPSQSLGKTVCYHSSSGSILQIEFFSFYILPNEVMMIIAMHGVSMAHRIVRKCDVSWVACRDSDLMEYGVLAIQNLPQEEAHPNFFLSS